MYLVSCVKPNIRMTSSKGNILLPVDTIEEGTVSFDQALKRTGDVFLTPS